MSIYLFEKYTTDIEDNREVTYIDLNEKDANIKTDTLYSFLGVRFMVRYSDELSTYSTILNSPDDSKFDTILYDKDLDSLQNKIRFSAKDMIDDLEGNFENVNLTVPKEDIKVNLNAPLENSNISIDDTLYFYISVDTGDVYAINKDLDKNKTYNFIVDNIDKGIFKYKDSVIIKNIINSKLKDTMIFNLYI